MEGTYGGVLRVPAGLIIASMAKGVDKLLSAHLNVLIFYWKQNNIKLKIEGDRHWIKILIQMMIKLCND